MTLPPDKQADVTALDLLFDHHSAVGSEPGGGGSLAYGNAIEVVVARLDAGADAVRASAVLLSQDERQRAARFAFAHDRRRFTIARALLRRLLGARLGVPPGSVGLVYGRRGKPALAPSFAGTGLGFNVSHCNGVAVYGFTRGAEIGIDVEAVRAIPDADEIAACAFSRRENEAYLALDPRDRPLGFFNCWTRKEAFVKALGDGLRHGLDRFDVSLAPAEPARLLRVADLPGERCGWSLRSFSPGAGMVGAFVVHGACVEEIVVRSLGQAQVTELEYEHASA